MLGKHLSKLLVTALVGLALMIEGCSAPSVMKSPGEEFEVSNTIEFYFAVGYDKYITITDETVPVIIADPVWVIPEGLVLEDSQISIKQSTISWSTAGADHKVSGYIINVTAKMRVTEVREDHNVEVLLQLPYLAEAASALNAEATFPKHFDVFLEPDKVRVAYVTLVTNK